MPGPGLAEVKLGMRESRPVWPYASSDDGLGLLLNLATGCVIWVYGNSP